MLEESEGNLWFGGHGGVYEDGGVSRFDGENWEGFNCSSGLGSDVLYEIVEDSFGGLWFGTSGGGLSHYDGEMWVTYDAGNGLAGWDATEIVEERLGNLWIWGNTWEGVQLFEPDRVAPQTVIAATPPSLSPGSDQTIHFVAAFKEERDAFFSYSLDGSPWSEWSEYDFWQGRTLPDGEHTFKVRARDVMGNVDSTPAVCSFEIDATPPAPIISSPAYGDAVRDSLVIEGRADDLRFHDYDLEVRPAEAGVVSGAAELSELSITPRVFSPEGRLCRSECVPVRCTHIPWSDAHVILLGRAGRMCVVHVRANRGGKR
jgi:hypothetical protein